MSSPPPPKPLTLSVQGEAASLDIPKRSNLSAYFVHSDEPFLKGRTYDQYVAESEFDPDPPSPQESDESTLDSSLRTRTEYLDEKKSFTISKSSLQIIQKHPSDADVRTPESGVFSLGAWGNLKSLPMI